MPLARAIEEQYASWLAAGMPLRNWPWNSPGPGVRFVEQGRTWDDAAVRVESLLVELTGPVEVADRGDVRRLGDALQESYCLRATSEITSAVIPLIGASSIETR